MTLNALGGLAVPTHPARAAPSGKEEPTTSNGFEEALEGKGSRRQNTADARTTLNNAARTWNKDSYAQRAAFGTDRVMPEDATTMPVDVEPAQDAELERELSLAEILDLVAAPAQVPMNDAAATEVDIPNELIEKMLADQQENAAVSDEGIVTGEDPLPDRPATSTSKDAATGTTAANPATPASTPVVDIRKPGEQLPGNSRSAPAIAQHATSSATFAEDGEGELPASIQPTTEGAPRAAQAPDFGANRPQAAAATSAANDPMAGKVNVLGFSSTLAPSSVTNPQLSLTSAGVVAALEGEPTWRQVAADPSISTVPRTPTSLSGVNTLRIQLNPAELGMVTARLTAAGSQLSIEIQVESNDARQRLSTESEAILKALRAIGFDVEKVTIQQTSPNAQSQQQAQAGGSGREQFQADQQARDEANTRGRGGQNSTGGGERGSSGHGEASAERAGSGVYI